MLESEPSPPSAPPLPRSALYSVDASANATQAPPSGEKRQEFSNYAEFLLTSVGYCVGLGNLIVYPGRVYNHGRGAFVVCYFIFLFLLGIPMYTHDLKVGQYYRKGAYGSFTAMHRNLWGTGLAHIIIAGLMIIYFNTIIGWAMIYLWYSFQSPLPWSGDTPAFFYDTVCQVSDGLFDVNGMNWPVFGANAAAWALTCAVLIQGVSSGGKVVWLTVTLPYVCIIALIVRGMMLDGATDGVRAYLEVDVAAFADFQTWSRAATQVFYSTGVSMGAIITFGSYQQDSNRNYVRDGAMIPTINALTSLLGGFAIFPMLGFLAKETGAPIDNLDLTGFGITFVAYTQGLASFPNIAAQAFSVVFFLMIITLGIDTQIGVTEAVITFAKETPLLARAPTWAVTVLTCVFFWALSLPCTTDAGYYWVTLLWDYGNFMSMFIVAGFGLLGSCYFAGLGWHNHASELLRGKRENWFLLFFWRVVNPILCFALFGISAVSLSPYPTSLANRVLPLGGQVLSGFMNFAPAVLTVLAILIPPLCRRRKEGGGGSSEAAWGAVKQRKAQQEGDSHIYGDEQAQAEAAASAATVIQLSAVTRKNSERYAPLD